MMVAWFGAAPTVRAASDHTSVIMLAPPASGGLVNAIRSQLVDLAVVLEVRPLLAHGRDAVLTDAQAQLAAAPSSTLCALWVDAQDHGGWYLYIADRGGHRVMRRRLGLEEGGEAMMPTAIGFIVRSFVQATLAGIEVPAEAAMGAATEVVVDERPQRNAPVDEPAPWVVSAAAGAMVALYGKTVLRPVLQLRLGAQLARTLGAHLAYQQQTPVRLRDTSLGVKLRSHTGAIALAWQPQLGALSAELGVAGELDYLTWDVQGTDPGVQPTTRTHILVPLASTSSALSWQWAHRISLFIRVQAEVPLRRFRVAKSVLGETTALSRARTVAPACFVGLSAQPF